MLELCESFGSTPQRKTILLGFLDFRAEYHALGITGFQWVAGSFVEDIEAIDRRPPNDIDVATFIATPDTTAAVEKVVLDNPHLFNKGEAKERFRVDQVHLPLRSPASKLVTAVNYWYALYTHRRGRVWKGILRVELDGKADDLEARRFLAGGS